MRNENLITWLLMLAALVVVACWGGMSMGFQRDCESRCGSDRVLTPIMNFHEVCLCNEEQGRWQIMMP